MIYISQASSSQRHGEERRSTISWPASAEYEDTDDILPSPSGEFDHDESAETVARVRASKSTIRRGPGPTGVRPSQAAKAGTSGYTGYIPLALRTESVRCYHLFYKLDC